MEQEDYGYSAVGTVIDSEKHETQDTYHLIVQVFRILYETEDLDKAINLVLKIAGKQFNVSRAYIFENTDDGLYGSNTYEWCNEGIKSQMSRFQNAEYKSYGDYASLFDDKIIFYCRDIYTLKPEYAGLFSSQGIHSILQCGFKYGTVFGGFVGFDECSGLRLWTQEEVSTLSFIAQILSVFLKQKK